MKSNQEEDIEKKVADTLSSLDNVERARVNPFFFARMKAKMQAEKGGFGSLFVSPQFSMAVASVILLLCLNFYIMISYEVDNSTQPDEVSAFIDGYQIEIGTVYELNE